MTDLAVFKSKRARDFQFNCNLESNLKEKESEKKSTLENFEGLQLHNSKVINRSINKQKNAIANKLYERREKSVHRSKSVNMK